MNINRVVAGTPDNINTIDFNQRQYELSNHLGNVLATFTGRKLGVEENGELAYYNPEVITANDYYPFGQTMEGRTYTNENLLSSNYRFGFNGKEKDQNGEFGSLTHYDYGFRIYNPSIGKFLSVDPLTRSYPMLTPYQFASNTPIFGIDLDGGELLDYKISMIEIIGGRTILKLSNVSNPTWHHFSTHNTLFSKTNTDGSTELNMTRSIVLDEVVYANFDAPNVIARDGMAGPTASESQTARAGKLSTALRDSRNGHGVSRVYKAADNSNAHTRAKSIKAGNVKLVPIYKPSIKPAAKIPWLWAIQKTLDITGMSMINNDLGTANYQNEQYASFAHYIVESERDNFPALLQGGEFEKYQGEVANFILQGQLKLEHDENIYQAIVGFSKDLLSKYDINDRTQTGGDTTLKLKTTDEN